MVDADGATKFADLERLEKRLVQVPFLLPNKASQLLMCYHYLDCHQAEKNGLGVAVGSRYHMQEKNEAVAQV